MNKYTGSDIAVVNYIKAIITDLEKLIDTCNEDEIVKLNAEVQYYIRKVTNTLDSAFDDTQRDADGNIQTSDILQTIKLVDTAKDVASIAGDVVELKQGIGCMVNKEYLLRNLSVDSKTLMALYEICVQTITDFLEYAMRVVKASDNTSVIVKSYNIVKWWACKADVIAEAITKKTKQYTDEITQGRKQIDNITTKAKKIIHSIIHIDI